MKAYIYQIIYSEALYQHRDSGYLVLDNRQNERPDWREYWPIRNFLLNASLEEDAVYGFFSPKFQSKTGLSAHEVHRFLATQDADVYLFSPFFDLSAFMLNVFEQAEAAHEGVEPVFREVFAKLQPQTDPFQLVMTSRNTVFCNYFAAKPRFWLMWLDICEKIFALAEDNETNLGSRLRSRTRHDSAAESKVFLIERIASLLLCLSKWQVHVYDPLQLPLAPSQVAEHASRAELCMLDALKIAFNETHNSEYLDIFFTLGDEIQRRYVSL